MDDAAGKFTDVHGQDTDTLALTATVGAQSGLTYAFKYRAKNIYGWSDFSAITHVLAASPPDTPAKPEFISATNNSISIQLFPSLNDNGSPVTDYVLEMDDGD